MGIPDFYLGREQTLVKHTVLKSYLERFAHIIGSWCDSITYVDCFSGPWKSQDPEMSDTSFAIAINELRTAKEHLRESLKRTVRMRCFFVEEDEEAACRLRKFADSISDIEIEVRNSTLAESISRINDFVRKDKSTFPFFFIDPTGWTGFEMSTIQPLFQFPKAEVVVNFMSYFVERSIRQSEFAGSFVGLFGRPDYLELIEAKAKTMEFGDAVVSVYGDELKKCGGFTYASRAIVIHREFDRKYFNLIYATKYIRGLEVFRQAEKAAMDVMEKARLSAMRRNSELSGQFELIPAEEIEGRWEFYEQLREQHLTSAKNLVLKRLQSRGKSSFDEIWEEVILSPMVWASDIQQWIDGWTKQGMMRIEGLSRGERTLKRGHGHMLVCT